MTLYSWDEKVEALTILKAFNFNYERAVKETGISAGTLRQWKKRYADKIFDDIKKNLQFVNPVIPYNAGIKKATHDLKIGNENFFNKAWETKERTLDKLKELIEKEKNLSRVVEALKVLHEITTKDIESDDPKIQNNYMLFVKEQYGL